MRGINAISLNDGLIRLWGVFIFTLTLAACGGGDGFPGFRSDSGRALYTTAPAGGVTVSSAGTGNYTIGGGTSGYTAVSSNSVVAASTVADSILTINGLSGGAATIVIRDAAGATLSLPVTVTPARALFTTAPSSLTVALAAAPTYTIGGGTAPYVASSGNVAVATASVNGATLTITGVAVGKTPIVVLDLTGSATTIEVTVPASSSSGNASVPLFTTAPTAITIATGTAPSYAIGGGTAPYKVVSSNVIYAVANVTTGTTLNIIGVATGTANLVITDAVGATQTISVTVSSATSTPLVVTPSVASANVGDVLTFRVGGGSPVYDFIVNNPSIATVSPATVTTSGASFTATLRNGGSTTVAVVDTLGQTTTFALTALVAPPAPARLALSPSALTLGEDYSTPIALNIYNGTGPYKAYTSDLLLSTVSVAGSTLTVGSGPLTGTRCITPGGALKYVAYDTYSITISVVDALGAVATSIITIQDNGKGVTPSGC